MTPRSLICRKKRYPATSPVEPLAYLTLAVYPISYPGSVPLSSGTASTGVGPEVTEKELWFGIVSCILTEEMVLSPPLPLSS